MIPPQLTDIEIATTIHDACLCRALDFICTRRTGHDGLHVAHSINTVEAAWDDGRMVYCRAMEVIEQVFTDAELCRESVWVN